MKEKEARFNCEGHQVVFVVEKEDGSFGSVQTGSYLFEQYGDDFRQKLAYWAKQNLDDLASGRVSGVGYHMQRLNMTVEDVAARTAISRRGVKKHMSVKGFAAASVRQLAAYAEVFGVPLAGLFQVTAQPCGGAAIGHKPTANPYAVITTCGEQQA